MRINDQIANTKIKKLKTENMNFEKKIFVFINMLILLILIGGYFYVPFHKILTASKVYACVLGLVITYSLYSKRDIIKINYLYISFFMICINEIMFAALNNSAEDMKLFLTTKLVFYIWPLFFAYVSTTYDYKKIKIIVLFTASIFFLTSVKTIIGLNSNPAASRLLAGHASVVQHDMFTKMGIGGYEFIYAGVFLIPAMIYCSIQSKKNSKIIVTFIFAMVGIYTVVKSNYTIAVVLLCLLTLVLLVYKNNIRRNLISILVIIIGALIFSIFGLQLLKMISIFASNNGQETIAARFNMLFGAFSENHIEQLRRIQLYNISLDTIFKYPLVGGMWFKSAHYGGHSGLLDYIAQFGIGSMWLFVYLKESLRLQLKKIQSKNLKGSLIIINIFFYVFISLNMFSIYPEISIVVFFIIPLLFMHTDNQNITKDVE